MELAVLVGGFLYLTNKYKKPEEKIEYHRNVDEPICPKCFYNAIRGGISEGGNSATLEAQYPQYSDVNTLRKKITESIYDANRFLMANKPYNEDIIDRQIILHGDDRSRLGKTPQMASGWFADVWKRENIPRVLGITPATVFK